MFVERCILRVFRILQICLQVDVDECEDLATRYQIASMPTFVFIKNCEVVTQFSGANANKLEELINEHAA